jgi:RimJ/RimL family protein N-acetyltransferase
MLDQPPARNVAWTCAGQRDLLAAARPLALSRGWATDAFALAAYDPDTKAILAVGVMQHRRESDAEVHWGTTGGLSLRRRGLLEGFLGFTLARVPRLFAPIDPANADMQIIALRAGFTVAGFLRDGMGEGTDAVLYSIDRAAFETLPRDPLTINQGAA